MDSKKFLMLLEGTADAAFAVNAAGRISAWNNAAAELFGRSERDALNVQCHQILQCSDENGVVCSEHCVVERAANDDRPQMSFDLRLQTRSGKLWCSLSTLIASDPASGTRHAIHIVRPCEMRKRLEQAMIEFVRTQATSVLNVDSTVSSTSPPGVNMRLTAREVEVLKSLAKGRSTRAIADQLNISSATVSNHIKHILTKFDVHSRLEAIRHAESVGVI